MSELFDYVFDIEAVPDDDRIADGLCAVFLNARGTGSSGVGTPGGTPCDGPAPGEEDQDGFDPQDGGCLGIVFPGLEASGEAGVSTAAEAHLPVPVILGRQAGWFPGAALVKMPPFLATAWGRILIVSRSALPPLFGLARAGYPGQAGLPPLAAHGETGALGLTDLPGLWTVLAASGLSRRGNAAPILPRPIVEAYACGLENPVVRRTPQAAVVGLLNRGSPVLAALAASLAGGQNGPDETAAAVLYAVSNLLDYVADPGSLDHGDQWSCCLATWFRGQGDCEDGAILMHGLMLAAGLPESRLATLFGRVGPDNLGHAWTCYKRVSDERWTILDWTTGPRSFLAGPLDFPTLEQSQEYHSLEYVLTASSFYQARMSVAGFFPAIRADALCLPASVCTGIAAPATRGAIRLGAGERPACQGLTGAAGVGTCPAPRTAARGGWRAARTALPGPLCLGETGGWAGCAIPRPYCAGNCVAVAAGGCRLPSLAVHCAGAGQIPGHGRCIIPGGRLRGCGNPGELCRGAILCPGLGGRLGAMTGFPGFAECPLPVPRVGGWVWFDILGAGGMRLRGLRAAGLGTADMASAAGRSLEYGEGEAWR